MEQIQGFLLLNIYALLIIVALCIIFSVKKRQHQMEDVTYSRFLLVNFLMSFSGIVLGVLVIPEFNTNQVLVVVANKIYLVFLLLWVLTLTFYTFYVSVIKHGNAKNQKKVFNLICLLNIFLVCLFPINVEVGEKITISTGLAINYTYLIFGLGFLLQIIFIIIDHKNLKSKKYIPIYLLIFMGTLTLVLQMIFPNLNYLINPSLVFIALVMYFTIENPDMKMIEELIKTKELANSTSENKSMFIYDIVQKIKNPLFNIKEIISEIKETEDISLIKENLNDILIQENRVDLIINNILGISNVNSDKIRVYNDKYDLKLLLKEMNLKYKDKFNEEIDFRVVVPNNVPDKLFGDKVRIKQILCSLINNAANNTKRGYLEIAIEPILKQDVCRLIFTVEDSGIGMTIEDTLHIFDDNNTIFNVNDTEKLDVKMPNIKKIVEYMGGTIFVESEAGKGTKVTFVLDQKIPDDINNFEYNNLIKSRKNILIVDKNFSEIKTKIDKLLYEENIKADYTEYGIYALKKIREKVVYDLIMINDNIDKTSCEEVVNKIFDIEHYNGKVVIITSKENIKKYDNKKIYRILTTKVKIKDSVPVIIDFLNEKKINK